MIRITTLFLLFCTIVSIGSAQDSVKKAHPSKIIPKTTTAAKPAATAAKITTTTPAVIATRDTTTAASLTDHSLNGQYQFLLTKVYHYQQPLIASVWKNALDTLKANKSRLKDAQSKITSQAKNIDSLKSKMILKDEIVSSSQAKVNAIGIIGGVIITKATYNLIMWGLVIVFGVTAFVVIARSGSYSREAKYRIKLYNELEEEFRNYKAKANEKEKKLARELQTERNKLDELLGNS